MLRLVDEDDMSSLIELWAKHQVGRGFSIRTVDRRRWTMSKLLEHLEISRTDLLGCPSDHLERWLMSYPVLQTRYSMRSDVHQFFVWAIRRGHAITDPTIDVDPPRLPKRLPTPVPTRDITRLIDCCTGDTLAMIMLASHEGLRVSEIARLNHRDIQDGCVYVRAGKGQRDRSVPMSLDVEQVLPTRAGDLFPHLTGQGVSDRIRYQMRKLDIQHRPHDLRHSFGTELARRGTPIEIIAHGSRITRDDQGVHPAGRSSTSARGGDVPAPSGLD